MIEHRRRLLASGRPRRGSRKLRILGKIDLWSLGTVASRMIGRVIAMEY